MSEPRKPRLILPIAITLAVLLANYVGAYYGTVACLTLPGGQALPLYQIGSDDEPLTQQHWWSKAMAPIHWLDRRIRPHVWTPQRKWAFGPGE